MAVIVIVTSVTLSPDAIHRSRCKRMGFGGCRDCPREAGTVPPADFWLSAVSF